MLPATYFVLKAGLDKDHKIVWEWTWLYSNSSLFRDDFEQIVLFYLPKDKQNDENSFYIGSRMLFLLSFVFEYTT